MIMDGGTFAVGAVGSLREVKNAIGVARAVMTYTDHTLLVGDLATEFAVEMGFKRESLSTNRSRQMHSSWKNHNCQPNFRKNVVPDPKKSCGPYTPNKVDQLLKKKNRNEDRTSKAISPKNHDTIGMVVIDSTGEIWAGTSTNGANNKIPGRVGDSPVMGAGAYASNHGGGAAATGDGDIMMRFLPSYRAVLEMEKGAPPDTAAKIAMKQIARHYPDFSGALVAVNPSGEHGAYCYGFSEFSYSVASTVSHSAYVVKVPCHK
ncbi:N(4)-(Beta-N-acetylglucosaminyl)-L-asparaginase [Elysia marginata]|uniref:N(4)-(beta-N-acetylglucosaminyl)-L-asparaginase n=1 Tax=Elysia marginata TaxID=1093978 RepID=A0AAV4EYK9_9GAST|nr:N(4)-(Beta-N-acetylglucosaminyl)-L-asparaginase [Elysia marginata]